MFSQSESLALQFLLDYAGPVQYPLDPANLLQASPAQWDAVVQYSLEHRIAPLVYQRLKDTNHLSLPPEEAQRRLQEAYQRSIITNIRIYQALDEILESLGDGSILVILLKGICLAEKIYHNIGLRPMVAIDLLVPRQQLSQA